MIDEKPKPIRQAAAKARAKSHDVVCDLWWWLLVRGIAMIALAVCALVWPQKTVGLMVKILGLYLIFDGIWAGASYAMSKEKKNSLLIGAVGLLVGAILLFWTDVSGRVFMTIVGIWALLQGVGLYFTVRNEEDAEAEARTMVKIVALSLAVAGLVLIVWPSSGVVAIGWLMSAVAAVIGGGMVYVAMKLRTVANRIGGSSTDDVASE